MLKPKKVKKYVDTNFYKLFLDILRIFHPYYKNMQKDFKFNIGQKMFQLIIDMIHFNINSYNSEEKAIKFELANNSFNYLVEFEILLKYCLDLKILSEKQCANLSKITGEVKTNLTNWKESLK